MDESLKRRFELFEKTGQVSPEVVAFVRGELERVADGWKLTLVDESVGMLVSHLVMALERVRSGEALVDYEEEVLDEELRERRWAIEKAESIARNGQERLNISLSESEVKFVALHLAAIVEGQDAEVTERRVDGR